MCLVPPDPCFLFFSTLCFSILGIVFYALRVFTTHLNLYSSPQCVCAIAVVSSDPDISTTLPYSSMAVINPYQFLSIVYPTLHPGNF